VVLTIIVKSENRGNEIISGKYTAVVLNQEAKCPGPESNRHSRCQPRDFKSLVSTCSTTRAEKRKYFLSWEDINVIMAPSLPGVRRGVRGNAASPRRDEVSFRRLYHAYKPGFHIFYKYKPEKPAS
jgi:hypothetical protein